MFTVEQIEQAHKKVKSGADFPKYIQEIKQLGVTAFETWVIDNHTEYFGKNDYQTKSRPQYENLAIGIQQANPVCAIHLLQLNLIKKICHAFSKA